MTDADGTLRTFIALPLPAEWTSTLESVIENLSNSTAGAVRWVQPSGIHLTLKFLGPTEARLVPDILAGLEGALQGAQAPQLSLLGLGTFPNNRNPRVLWAGVTGELDILENLYGRVETLMVELGWAAERRPFRPHLTIGRVRDRASSADRRKIGTAIWRCSIPKLEPWRPNVIRLYQSELTPQGAIYSNLGEVEI